MMNKSIKIVGVLDSMQEADEIKFIVKVFATAMRFREIAPKSKKVNK